MLGKIQCIRLFTPSSDFKFIFITKGWLNNCTLDNAKIILGLKHFGKSRLTKRLCQRNYTSYNVSSSRVEPHLIRLLGQSWDERRKSLFWMRLPPFWILPKWYYDYNRPLLPNRVWSRTLETSLYPACGGSRIPVNFLVSIHHWGWTKHLTDPTNNRNVLDLTWSSFTLPLLHGYSLPTNQSLYIGADWNLSSIPVRKSTWDSFEPRGCKRLPKSYTPTYTSALVSLRPEL